MQAKILDGKKAASVIKEGLKARISKLPEGGRPGLAVVLVGEDPASKVYVGQKEKASVEVGINSFVHKLPAGTTQPELLALIEDLNCDPRVHGILVQLPLPEGFDADAVISAIHPEKDVDGFHAVNVGRLWTGGRAVEPCTPKGIMALLDSTGIELKGLNAVVIGRSNIVGKPISAMLLSRHCTLTICHSRTKDLPSAVRGGDIVVAAVGRPNFVTGDMIKQGAIVIDVGINRVGGKLAGDVEFESASQKASWITPVPGGVGPMTIVMLMKNTLELAGIKQTPGT
ncbi:MAG: bifunctional methylenetetrahydrofolate dehydrogenase/methenyltetrahydrofolate cyclohydrolase FolD [Synergistaceae bacterium]|nr:bifunctional methylenetetrahydrofolate dehydrogenase/methenyltetrahydrofolate cyclohydrolase FolD [Synergistaceae bacterium]